MITSHILLSQTMKGAFYLCAIDFYMFEDNKINKAQIVLCILYHFSDSCTQNIYS